MANPNVNSESYQVQLDDKTARLQEMFSEYTMPSLEVFTSDEQHYRMRAMRRFLITIQKGHPGRR